MTNDDGENDDDYSTENRDESIVMMVGTVEPQTFIKNMMEYLKENHDMVDQDNMRNGIGVGGRNKQRQQQQQQQQQQQIQRRRRRD
jgi:hypothetical protein